MLDVGPSAIHRVADCPFKGLHDTNHQHHVLWSESTMGKGWMAEGHDTFVEQLYFPGWELRRKKRAEESSEEAETSKRVRYNSESEDDHPARDRRTLQERKREDRDLKERKARERCADRGRSSNRERSRDRDNDRRQDSRTHGCFHGRHRPKLSSRLVYISSIFKISM